MDRANVSHFSLTLGDKAQRWYRRLHQRSIKNWNDLITALLAQFMGLKARTMPKEWLVSIKKGKGEYLKCYLSRFNKQFMEVEKISDDAVLMAVLTSLRSRMRFWWSVHEDRPRTYYELLNRAKKYISVAEVTFDQEEVICDPDLINTVKKMKLDRNPQFERRKDGRKRDGPKI